MPLIYLESLPHHVTKGSLLAFLENVGGLDRRRVGKIDLQPNKAAIEVPNGWQYRVAKAIDGQSLGERRVRAWADSEEPGRPGDEDHFQRLAGLLELESQAEARQAAERARRLSPADAERTGTSIVELIIRDEEPGLGGRYLVQLAKRDRSVLSWTRLDVGTPVTLSQELKRDLAAYRGVVSQRTTAAIQVALSSQPEESDPNAAWRLDLAYDEVAVQRQRQALRQAAAARGDRSAELRQVLLGRRPTRFRDETELVPLDAGLNESQAAAVRFALSAEDVALIHGPPGTGKTTTVVELIRQAVRRGEKVLACAPSNTAVDNVFERLLAVGEAAVRLGHPARVLPALRDQTLDLLVDRHPDVRLARKLVKDALALFRQANRYTRAKPAPGARREARQEGKDLLADARRLERLAAEHILDQADVLCATTTAIDGGVLGSRRFDLAVIDEACQSTEPGCWIPILRASRVVLAGDHCQLPPTVVSREAAAEGFGVSLFERLLADVGPQIGRRLTVQYRMHQSIMEFSSLEFYDAELEAAVSVAGHILADLPHVSAIPLTESPMEFIDTAGADYSEEIEPDGESRLNRQEAALVGRRVQALLDSSVAPGEIGVIAPYAAQVRHLREMLPLPELEVDTVDGFQGREKEAIVISLVRSNPQGEIGFLADVRRMNVALTRARRKLIVIGDTATLSGNGFYRRMIEYFESVDAYRTVWDEDVG